MQEKTDTTIKEKHREIRPTMNPSELHYRRNPMVPEVIDSVWEEEEKKHLTLMLTTPSSSRKLGVPMERGFYLEERRYSVGAGITYGGPKIAWISPA